MRSKIKISLDYIMDEEFVLDSNHQAGLYEDLSFFIRVFKRMMELAQKMIESTEKEEPNSELIRKMKEIPEDCSSLINKYHWQLQEGSPHKNTFYRFICRLNETVQIYKNRAILKTNHSVHFSEFVEKVEQSLLSYNMDRNIGRIFKKISHFTNKICQFCECAGSNPFNMEQAVSKKGEQQRGEQQSQLGKTKFSFNSSQSNFHKAMNVLNKRFHSLACLDIDFNTFKMSFFQAKNQKKEFFKEYFQRNLFIWRQITNYSKDFEDYLKKKARTSINRKNRFKLGSEKTDTSKRQTESNRKEAKSANTVHFAHENIKKAAKTQQLPILRQASNRNQQRQRVGEQNVEKDLNNLLDINFRDIQVQRRKTNYQIKNVYLTLNKIFPSNSQHLQVEKNIKQMNKDKLKMYGALKKGKLSLRTTKFIEPDKYPNRPILEVKPNEAALQPFTANHTMAQIFEDLQNNSHLEQKRNFKFNKHSLIPMSVAEKQNQRKAQILISKKGSCQSQGTQKIKDRTGPIGDVQQLGNCLQ